MATFDIPVEYMEKAPWLCSDKKPRLPGTATHLCIYTHPRDVISPSANELWFLYLLVNKLQKFMPKPKTQFWAGLQNPSGYLATSRKDVGEQEGSESIHGGSSSVSSAKQTLYRSPYLYRYLCKINIVTETQYLRVFCGLTLASPNVNSPEWQLLCPI